MRDADDDLRMQLDEELGDIRSLLMAGPSKPPAKDEVAEPSTAKKSDHSDYDAFVRELAFERRAKPQDRLKTAEEKAEEEAEELRKAESDRLKRMRGEEIDDESGGAKKGKRRAPQGDDLDDDLDIDGQTAADQYGLGTGIGLSDEDDEGDDEEGGEEDDEDEHGSEEEQDAALEDEGYGEAVSDDEDEVAGQDEQPTLASSTGRKAKKSKRSNTSKTSGAKALPFTFDCPIDHSDFLDLLEGHDIQPSQVPTVVKRIRTLYHPSLAEDNKYRLQGFLGVLLDHAVWSASRALESSGEERQAHVVLIEHLLRSIFELTTTYPTVSAQHFVEKFSVMERNLNRGLAKGALSPEARTWPGAPELTLLRIAGLIWPTSDQNHSVATPLALLTAHYLAHCRVRNLADITSGLYLTSLVLHQQSEAKRMVPEALNFVHNAILLLAPFDRKVKESIKSICSDYGIPTPDFMEEHTKGLSLSSSADGAELSASGTPALFDLLQKTTVDAESQQQLLGMVLNLATELAELYFGTTAFIEIFEPLRLVLDKISLSALSQELSKQVEALKEVLQNRIAETQKHRQPLRLHAHRAIPLASFIPKFDEGGRSRGGHAAWDPDSARSEAAKLKALVKKERKGAVRELRKDSQFLAQERAREKRVEDAEYKRKMGKIMAGLGEERSEQKQLAKEKAKLKKRAGK